MNLRKLAIKIILKRASNQTRIPELKADSLEKHFGEVVFTKEVMRKYLSKNVMKVVEQWEKGEKISLDVAEEVANVMKQWALSKGATHYTHWFQPLTGLTAEKHDSFFTIRNGKLLSSFSGEELLQQEPDASSLPSGGLRSTFEARGYTAWDPTSPAFIYGNTLCIPSVYISYNGDALDHKTPLIRSIEVINKYATQVAKLFNPEVESVKPTLGPEQEFFLIDEAFFMARPDLVLAGRTIIGAPPARGQQLEDHYFGSIPERVKNFMQNVELEAYKLGIPLRTRHNEVAPGQYEVAPEFEELNIAVDHNQLLMDLMDKIARKHHFRILFHEKPFARINGSGKHNNWSLITNTGINLFSPEEQNNNLRFLSFLSATLCAINEYRDLLRASIASYGNDLRLGGNEAPPPIISVFLGKGISKVLEQIEKEKTPENIAAKEEMKLNIPRIPDLMRDNTDRNRTSPFAFTGNKFEFRAVGSSANNASAMTVLNTIVADKLNEFLQSVNSKMQEGKEKNIAIFETIKEFVIRSKNIRFEGDNYSKEWFEEAKKRGFNIYYSTPEALKVYNHTKNKELFTKYNILTDKEIQSRLNIQLERYIKTMEIEYSLMNEIIRTYIIPSVVEYKHKLAETMRFMKEIDMHDSKYEYDLLTKITSELRSIIRRIEQLEAEKREVEKKDDWHEKALAYRKRIFPIMEELREIADSLEERVEESLWKLPKYREMLFLR